MSKYTPGPWTVISGAIYHSIKLIRLASMDRSGPNKAGPIECDANARLIAAAPELLETLEAIIQGGIWQADDNAPLCISITRAEIRQARDVIAKAKGENP